VSQSAWKFAGGRSILELAASLKCGGGGGGCRRALNWKGHDAGFQGVSIPAVVDFSGPVSRGRPRIRDRVRVRVRVKG
jgi:hypothetical protein